MNSVDLLILSAYGPELRGMVPQLGEPLEGEIGGIRVMAKVVGVGLPVAGAAAARRLSEVRPRAVIHLGTCGVYPGLTQYRPHDVVVGKPIKLLDHAVVAGKGEFPAPMTTEVAPDEVMSGALLAASQKARAAPVASPLSSTKNDVLGAAVPTNVGAHMENLEAFSIGHACLLARVPFATVLAASHMTGTRADEDFRQFQREASLRAAELVINWLHNGARGLPHGSPRSSRP
jgi:nucleoside phosphorylase